jgi:RNA polymerase sporulation-specific sigma factor
MQQVESPDSSEVALLAAAQSGDAVAMEHLLEKHRDLVRMRARNYFIVGGDRDDIIQEGMIGLYKAVRDFRAEKLANFRAFADLCITRQIITAIKTATRLKHVPLNQYVSLNKPAFRGDDSDRTLIDILESPKNVDPEDLLVRQEFSNDMKERMTRNLSEFESKVLAMYLAGKSYSEMSTELERRAKAIDNALQRVKRKIEKSLAGLVLT